jgi:hypothetical protein
LSVLALAAQRYLPRRVIENAERSIGFPPSITASFQGTAAAFQDSKSNMLVLIIPPSRRYI